MISVFIAGKAAAQGSKRHVGGGRMIEQSKYVAPWRADVRAALTREDGKPKAFFDGEVKVTMVFVLIRPTSAPKKRQPTAAKTPDIDKAQRAVFDACTSAGVWRDDSQVVVSHAYKVVAEIGGTPGLHLFIEPCESVKAWTVVDTLPLPAP